MDQLLGETGRRPATSLDLLAPLTRREQQVMELLVDGLTNREIALRLVVEPDTVKDHVQSIIKKLGATDRTHAAVIAVRGGLVSSLPQDCTLEPVLGRCQGTFVHLSTERRTPVASGPW